MYFAMADGMGCHGNKSGRVAILNWQVKKGDGGGRRRFMLTSKHIEKKLYTDID